jgi:hypothetical protein
MAGAGYKLFNTGDVLTAAQVNTYLQEQTVMVFASSTARTTALSGVLSEGMVSYLQDTNAVEVYNGSAWVSLASDQTPLTTKGDLFTYSTADARLAVGNNGETLVADSSQTTGLRYNPPVASLANPVINGGMDIWQRGTSFSAGSATYTADRWKTSTGGPTITVSRQTTSDTTNLPNIQYASRVQRNSGQTSTTAFNFAQSFETVNSLPFAGKAVTFSFYARAGANYSPTSSALTANLYSGTGTDQSWIDVAYTGQATVAGGTATLTTTWQRFVFTGTVGATATELAIVFQAAGTGTAGANDWYEVTGVQIDLGTWTASTAPTFRRSGGTLAGELAACQRYFWQIIDGSVSNAMVCNANSYTTTDCRGVLQYPVTMRTAPTLVQTSSTNYWQYQAASSDSFDALTIASTSTNTTLIYGSAGVNGLTAGQGGTIFSNNSAARLALSAEL